MSLYEGLPESHCHSEAVEINCAWHCNLRCVECSHGSPNLQVRFSDARGVALDLSRLSRWLRVDHVRLLGGEPLLHPQFVGIANAVRSAAISSRIRLLTNGLSLAKRREVWDLVDEIHVSVYPSTRAAFARALPTVRELVVATGVEVVVKYFDYFRVAFRPTSSDDRLTDRIFRTCQIASRWRCLTVEDGYLYRCPQSALHELMEPGSSSGDRLLIESISSLEEVGSWIEGTAPLAACRGCCGSAGALVPHRQHTARARPVTGVPRSTGVIDESFLGELEKAPWLDNGCVVAEEVIRR